MLVSRWILRFSSNSVLICFGLNLAVLALRWFLIRRLQFLAVLHASPGGLTTGRYLRLISLAMVDVTLVIFGTLFTMISSFKNLDLMAYGSWQSAHQDFGQVLQFPEDIHDNVTTAVPLYLFPIYSFTFFIFFGFGEEAIHEYLRIGKILAAWCRKVGHLKR
jgi:pheromone a factor receptor